MKKLGVKAVLAAVRKKGYKVFERPYELNLVGIRDDNMQADHFDDLLYVFWKDDRGKWELRVYRITTDPGKVYLKSGLNGTKGISILAEGQYINAYAIGLHQGKYKALRQVGPVTCLIDDDGNAYLNFNSRKKKQGIFGINIHRAKKAGTTESVYLYSAGCQVFANANDFEAFLKLCDKHAAKYGNKFTYTLIDEKAAKRAKRRLMIVAGVGIVVALVGVYLLYRYGVLQKGVALLKKEAEQLQQPA